jgi:tetratricopeptide (TPR) repeat protein/nucleoside-triphosphatase THEP1
VKYSVWNDVSVVLIPAKQIIYYLFQKLGLTMSQNFTWKAQPIFISSTFTDMMAERDVLRDFVFKELEEKLYERRVRLEPIDLRWGVETNTEKEKEHKELMVLKVCLNEIDRCEPFFIGIIGDRYGWIPPEKRMEDAEKEKGFKSKLINKSVTALEIEYGVLASKKQLKRSFFFFRDPLPYDRMPENICGDYSDIHNPELKDIDTKKRLDDFKKLITETVGKERVFTYKAEWDGNGVAGLEDFKKKVTEQLWKELDAETKELEDKRPKTWEEEEQKYLLDFIEERTISFSGREDVIIELKKFTLSESGYDNWGKCLTGESGFGKSALFAKIYKELQKEDVVLLGHAAGISLRSNSMENMLTIWIEELATHLKINVTEELKEKDKFDDLTKLFAQLLSRTSVNKRVVVLVDALNQFERTAHAKYVNWLPELIPANSKFIFTAITGEETEHLAKHKGIAIEELKPINKEEAQKIINIICERYHKKLNNLAVEILLDKKKDDDSYAYSNPLWLTMAVDEFLLMDEDDFARMKELEGDAEQKLKQLLIISAKEMPDDIAGMYGYVFSKCKMFGEEFVNALLSYIGISRNGLRESDLEQLINKYTNAKWENLNFASFRRYLRNHIVSKGELGLWDFRHVQVRESLKKSLLENEAVVIALHKNLAAHLEQIGNEDPLHLTEVLWHLFKCDSKKKAAEIYGSFDYDAIYEYSNTLKDILLENENNVNWVTSLILIPEIKESVTLAIINNVCTDLDGRIKDHVNLNTRLIIFQNVLNIAKRINQQNLNSVKSDILLSMSYYKVGDIYKALGDTKTALKNYENSFKLAEELLKRAPDSTECARFLADSYNDVGNIYESNGDTKNAIESYKSSLMIAEKLCKQTPDSAKFARNLWLSYVHVGDIYTVIGDTKNALQNYESSFKIAEELRKQNPDSTDYANNLSVSYTKTGDIYAALGDTSRALQYFESSFKMNEELQKRKPDSLECTLNLSLSYGRIGKIQATFGDTKSALESYENYLKIAKELHKRAPDSASYTFNLSVSYDKLGDVCKALGNNKSSLSYYENSFKILSELRKRNPNSADYAINLSLIYARMGDIYKAEGNTKSALQSYERTIEELRKLNFDPALYAKSLSVIYNRVGDIFKIHGDLKSALKNYRSSLKIAEELRKLNPDSGECAIGLSVSYNNVGDIYTDLGDKKSAIQNYESSLNIQKELWKQTPDSAEYAKNLAISYTKMGNIFEAIGDIKNALQSYESSLHVAKEILKQNPNSTEYRSALSLSYIKVGDIHITVGDMHSALQSYESSLNIQEELWKQNPESTEYANNLAVSYDRIGDINKVIGNTEGVLKSYENSSKLVEDLWKRNPESTVIASNLSASYDKIGDAYKNLNDTTNALRFFKSSLNIREELWKQNPDSAKYASSVALSYNLIGDINKAIGDTKNALKRYESSLNIREELLKQNPDSAKYARDLWVSYWKMATFNENISNNSAKRWWRKSYETLNKMKLAGLFISIEDEKFLKFLKKKFD